MLYVVLNIFCPPKIQYEFQVTNNAQGFNSMAVYLFIYFFFCKSQSTIPSRRQGRVNMGCNKGCNIVGKSDFIVKNKNQRVYFSFKQLNYLLGRFFLQRESNPVQLI